MSRNAEGTGEDAPGGTGLADRLGFDPEALRARYRAEREKRLRPDGTHQYVLADGDLERYTDDPFADQESTREPITQEVEVVVIGGGFGGLLSAARLREAGIEDIHMIEKGADFGGTWYWNRYPGVACDIESYIYLPLLEELGYIPKAKYATGAEIFAHSQAIGRHYDLYRDALFQTQVTSLRWDDELCRWIVATDRGDTIKARFVSLANGSLHRPKLPGIPGVTTFKGHTFHTTRWDYAYTGGDANGGMTGLLDKRVGIIGTGATAIQCIPHLGAWSKHLYVFQRTPSTVDVRNDRPTNPEWVADLEPGWQRRRMDNFAALTTGGPQDVDLINDGWTSLVKNVLAIKDLEARFEGINFPGDELKQLADFRKMEQIRSRVDEVISDPATAEALKPWYNMMCKRPCFHDDYLPTFNRPNVTLVDTKGRGVERITEHGAVVDGVEYELDCLVFATGFEVLAEFTRQSGYEIYGRNGLSLADKWRGGASTLHGVASRGFPNCFLISYFQTGYSFNFTHVIDEQCKHIAYMVQQAVARGAKTIEVTEAAEEEWVDTIIESSAVQKEFLENCTPGYFNNEGALSPQAVRNGFYGKGLLAFIELLEKWRAEGNLIGMELK